MESFADIDFRSEKYRGVYVVYQSSEDPGLFYKDYIEDVLLGLELMGAILLPSFLKFRAHHNKVFMEIIRDVSGSPLLQTIRSYSFGTLDDCVSRAEKLPLPAIIKQSSGARSQGVHLALTKRRVLEITRRISGTFSLINLRRLLMGIWNGKGYKRISNHRKKFLVQEFLEGLSCDYKVVVYKDKFYFFRRDIKAGDFRASGTPNFTLPAKPPVGLLDYAEEAFRLFDVPFASFDIAIKNGEFHLLEFQFVSFGQRAIEKSASYFIRQNERWQAVNGFSDLEENFVEAIVWYITK